MPRFVEFDPCLRGFAQSGSSHGHPTHNNGVQSSGGVAGSEAKRMAPRFEVSIITAQRGLPVGQTPSLPQAG